MPEIIFIGSIFLVFFAYFGYPATLVLVSWIRGRDVKSAEILPTVSFIVTVHNEEARIQGKLENTFSLDYPKDRFQILVASDGSNDRTNQIVRGYTDQGAELVDLPDRRGNHGTVF